MFGDVSKPSAENVVSDSVKGNWLDRHGPEWLKPYGRLARWDRPIGWWLLLWPCLWSAALVAVPLENTAPNLWHMILFLIGAIAMRGAGCTYNDLVDRDIDAKVARTASRPIPSGQVTPKQAAAFLVLQALAGLLVLLQFNRTAIIIGLCSLIIVAVYPFMKRITDWPQAVLGLAFSWGALVAWPAVTGELALPAVLLYAASFFWTIGYDTIYACQDREDDAVIGVRSTARLFEGREKPAVSFFFLIAFILNTAAVVTVSGPGLILLAPLLFAAHLTWQVLTLNPQDADNCLARFRSNTVAGWLFFLPVAALAIAS